MLIVTNCQVLKFIYGFEFSSPFDGKENIIHCPFMHGDEGSSPNDDIKFRIISFKRFSYNYP